MAEQTCYIILTAMAFPTHHDPLSPQQVTHSSPWHVIPSPTLHCPFRGWSSKWRRQTRESSWFQRGWPTWELETKLVSWWDGELNPYPHSGPQHSLLQDPECWGGATGWRKLWSQRWDSANQYLQLILAGHWEVLGNPSRNVPILQMEMYCLNFDL